ncbi:Uncharacterised protein [Actinobaculum suis]|uniref:Uncharacterized protein n=1 Tax=Actinobaculum suis TaxID=1657 RepID=A0A7Z8Y8C4_9ACTO|nr:Uncharacterised protein [Actinobaculum suis]
MNAGDVNGVSSDGATAPRDRETPITIKSKPSRFNPKR